MQFTGRNLALVLRGLNDALGKISNQIGICPDVFEYAEDIEQLEAERAEYEQLIARIVRRHPELAAPSD